MKTWLVDWMLTFIGSDYQRNRRPMEKAHRYFVIEFAATAEKYGLKQAAFEDNEVASVCGYAQSWSEGLGIPGRVRLPG